MSKTNAWNRVRSEFRDREELERSDQQDYSHNSELALAEVIFETDGGGRRCVYRISNHLPPGRCHLPRFLVEHVGAHLLQLFWRGAENLL